MPKLICTSRYIKNSKSKNAGNLIKYMGTREGVEKLSNGYGYLQKDVKNTVDAIVNELAKDSRIADFYTE